ncbi:uncharacterized protein EI90DRAFT_398008, partial [Cantharellus anzutake]|uniref:uncharacterized protein n=1 Tax=Cantharellus anzutake TaxID=1750568 RepID=UPI00190609DD
QTWFAVEAIPIYAVVGLACGGAGWYVSRLAATRRRLGPQEQPDSLERCYAEHEHKLMDHSGTLSDSWVRRRL